VKRAKNFRFYLAGSVAFITFIVYLSALRNGFVGAWDDNVYIVENTAVRSFNTAFFRWAFFDFYASNWHPLTWLSHALDYALWGLDPLGHHLTNIVLHAVNAFIVVLLVIRLLEAGKEGTIGYEPTSFLNERAILIAAGATGLLFGLHPLHVESVAWVAERKDLLCALFFLLSVMANANYAGEASNEAINKDRALRFFNKHYLAALGLFILALLSKPMAVSLPAVLLVLDWFPFNRIRSGRTLWAACVEKLPFIALSLVSSVLTVLAQRSGGSIASLGSTPLTARVLVAAKSLIAYLGSMMLPLTLAPYYPYPKGVSIFTLEYFFAIVLLVGITTICAFIVKQKLWLSAWSWYIITLVPVLGIVQVGGQSMADRYTYLPSLGPFFIAGVGAAWIAEKANSAKRWGILGRLACTLAAISLFFSLSYITIKQTGIWENSFVLWNYAITKGFVSSTAYNNRGLSFDGVGQRDEALADFEKAIRLDPSNYVAYNNMGALYGRAGMPHKAIEAFSRSIAVDPDGADVYYNRGVAYASCGQYDKALEDFSKTIELNVNDAAAYSDRGKLYLRTGSNALAMEDFKKACGLGNKEACNALRVM
jgi:tetratricopeptide (TPR) repeat protein